MESEQREGRGRRSGDQIVIEDPSAPLVVVLDPLPPGALLLVPFALHIDGIVLCVA
jgi:hypothetical protein